MTRPWGRSPYPYTGLLAVTLTTAMSVAGFLALVCSLVPTITY